MEEAADFADAIGYPVVLKLYSQTITHKTDVGGVQLDLGGRTAVKQAYEFIQKSVAKSVGKEHFDGVTVQPMLELKDGYELIVGASLDPQFGPVMLFGLGGQLVEVFKDSALGLPPLNATLARQMMSQTKIFHALHGVRGRKPINLDELEKILLRFSQLICEQRRIKESDINPLFASPEHLLALDARFVLHPKEVTDDELPRPAIRPYPIQYCSECTITGNVKVTIRPIRPEDEPALVKFHETLSYRTVYMRFGHDFHFAERTTHERLARVCFVDYDRQMYLVACVRDPVSSAEQIVAVGRLSRIRGTKEAIAAMIVADAYQNRGLGSKLAETLRGIAQNEKLERIYARVLQENQYMLQLCKSVGFELKPEEGGRFILGELKVQ
ncbi:MAG TPA: GNAT family N-acetyltransferase, partial [Oligoflexia bacterium]|nr:GNAT family N-acetyltransferase [Oligoflexia bacterium]